MVYGMEIHISFFIYLLNVIDDGAFSLFKWFLCFVISLRMSYLFRNIFEQRKKEKRVNTKKLFIFFTFQLYPYYFSISFKKIVKFWLIIAASSWLPAGIPGVADSVIIPAGSVRIYIILCLPPFPSPFLSLLSLILFPSPLSFSLSPPFPLPSPSFPPQDFSSVSLNSLPPSKFIIIIKFEIHLLNISFSRRLK